MDYRWKIENNWSFVLHEAPFFSVLAASSAARLLRSHPTDSISLSFSLKVMMTRAELESLRDEHPEVRKRLGSFERVLEL